MGPDFTVRFFDLDAIEVDDRLLSAHERERVGRKATAVLKQRQAASFQCLRLTLAEALGLAPEQVPVAIAPSGKPILEGHALQFNLSHSGGAGMLAWGPRELGADIEALIARPTDALAAEILSSPEQALWAQLPDPERQAWLTRVWCRKEAAVKATGSGLRVPPRSLDVGGGGEGIEAWSLALEGRHWRGIDLVDGVPAGFRAAVCVEACGG